MLFYVLHSKLDVLLRNVCLAGLDQREWQKIRPGSIKSGCVSLIKSYKAHQMIFYPMNIVSVLFSAAEYNCVKFEKPSDALLRYKICECSSWLLSWGESPDIRYLTRRLCGIEESLIYASSQIYEQHKLPMLPRRTWYAAKTTSLTTISQTAASTEAASWRRWLVGEHLLAI